jgi:hypothetical protein
MESILLMTTLPWGQSYPKPTADPMPLVRVQMMGPASIVNN